jgi:hypothetical protein
VLGAGLASCLSAVSVTDAAAQVGHTPTNSPYEDLKVGQSLFISAGWLSVLSDPAGVAPKSSVLGQLRYDINIGGPASLYARYAIAPTERTQLAPSAVAAKRVTGTPSVLLHNFDGGLDISLTGQKTWHRLMPSLTGGIGVVSDFAKADSGGYKFGTKFSFTYGLGLRYVRRGGAQFRVDLTSYLWQYEYPDGYFLTATDNTSVLTDPRNRTKWRSNYAFSAGVALPIFR